MSYQIAVVTEVHDTDVAVALDVTLALPDATDPFTTVPVSDVFGPGALLAMRRPVWTLGEILILNADGREVAGLGRKPSKWSVGITPADSIEDAVGVAQLVLDS